MEDTTDTDTIATPQKVDTIATPVPAKAEGEHHGSPEAVIAPPQPQMENGVKVYPPSFVPAKGILHYPKKALVWMEIEHIEVIHIAFFIGATIFLFIGMWKRPGRR